MRAAVTCQGRLFHARVNVRLQWRSAAGPSSERGVQPARARAVATALNPLTARAKHRRVRDVTVARPQTSASPARLAGTHRRRPRRQGTGARLGRHLAYRAPLVGVTVGLAVMVSLSATAPPPRTLEGLAHALGQAAQATGPADALVWERSGGSFWDALVGRHVLFVATPSHTAARDLFRARVRVSLEGQPVQVTSVRNLSRTPLGDVQQLVTRGRHAAFVTRAFDRVQGVTVLDLAGGELAKLTRFERLLVRLDEWVETGSPRGLGRTEIVLGDPPERAAIELRDDRLVMALGEPPSAAAVVLQDGTLETTAGNPHRAAAWHVPAVARDTGRIVRGALRLWLGAEKGAHWEGMVLGLRDTMIQPFMPPAPLRAPPEATSSSGTDPPAAPGAAAASWPPPPVAAGAESARDDEGVWRPPSVSGLARLGGGAGEPEPYLVETTVRPAPSLSSEPITLVAVDTRQLELRLAAGFAEPRAVTGPPGSGRMPTEDFGGSALQVVAAFNGARLLPERAGGMVQDQRVLVPPAEGAATVALDVRGRTWIGTWPDGDVVPDWVVSLRQSGDPLLVDGAMTAAAARGWEHAALSGQERQERSALCLTRSGHLLYAWSRRTSAPALAAALRRASCEYALALDTSSGHVGFVYLTGQGDGRKAQRLAKGMSVPPERFITASPRDFFYLVLHDPRPACTASASFEPDGGDQPDPSWLPAVHVAERRALGTAVRVVALAPNRFFWDLRPGDKERAGWTADGPLTEPELSRAMVAISLGVGFRKDNRRGLVLDGMVALPMRPDLGVIVSDSATGRLRIGLTVEGLAPQGDATELRLLAEGGELRSEARVLGVHKHRSAACLLPDDTLLIGTARYDSAEAITTALVELGCDRVVELNRGGQIAGFVHRAGTEQAPQAHYDDTVLYGLAVEAAGTARRLESHP